MTIVINGTLASDVEPARVIQNTATATWTSLDGVHANERDSSGGINGYTESNSANVTSLGLDMKLIIDQFREQLQNME